MDSFNLTETFLLIGLSQGLFIAISLQIIPNKNRNANKILSMLLTIAVVMLLGRVSYSEIPNQLMGGLGILGDTSIFLFGPLLYTYVRRLLYNELPIFHLTKIHYFPALLHLTYFIVYLFIGYDQYMSLHRRGVLTISYLVIEASGLCSLSYYITLSFISLNSYKRREKQEIAINQNVYPFLRSILYTLSVVAILWFITIVAFYGLRTYMRYINYTTMWMVVSIFIYLIGFYSFKQPEIFRLPFKREIKEEKDRLNPSEIHLLQKRLNYFMEEEKVYMNSDITLKLLAEKLNTSSNNLSWLLNKVYQQSFYEYINNFRVSSFIAKINAEEHKDKTLLSLAMEVGFNSKSTFNKAFKAITGTTPSSYIKSNKVA